MKHILYFFFRLIIVIAVISSVTSCSKLLDLVNESSDAFRDDLFQVSDSLENNIENLSDNLLDFLESDRMEILVDSVISQASQSFVKGLNIDSILGIVDANLDNTLSGVLDSLLSESVSDQIGQRLKQVLETSGLDPESLKSLLLNEETTEFLVNLKNEVLGNTTPALVDSIMEAAMLVFEEYYEKTIDPDFNALNENLNQISSNLAGESNTWSNLVRNGLIAGLSILAFALLSALGFWIYKLRKYRNLVNTIGDRINGMKDQEAYDDLTQAITDATKSKNLHKLLEESIKDVKEKSAKEWKDKDNQVLKLLSKYAKKGEVAAFSKDDIDKMKVEASKKGLLDHLESTLERYGEGG